MRACVSMCMCMLHLRDIKNIFKTNYAQHSIPAPVKILMYQGGVGLHRAAGAKVNKAKKPGAEFSQNLTDVSTLSRYHGHNSPPAPLWAAAGRDHSTII